MVTGEQHVAARYNTDNIIIMCCVTCILVQINVPIAYRL